MDAHSQAFCGFTQRPVNPADKGCAVLGCALGFQYYMSEFNGVGLTNSTIHALELTISFARDGRSPIGRKTVVNVQQ